MAHLLPVANPRLPVSNAVPLGPLADPPPSVVEGDAVSRAMHTTVQDGLTVIVNQVVTDVGGEQTTVTRSTVPRAEHTLTVPPRLDRGPRSNAAQHSHPTVLF